MPDESEQRDWLRDDDGVPIVKLSDETLTELVRDYNRRFGRQIGQVREGERDEDFRVD